MFGSFCLQVGLVPIANGIIIDNLASGQSIEQVRFRTGWPPLWSQSTDTVSLGNAGLLGHVWGAMFGSQQKALTTPNLV